MTEIVCYQQSLKASVTDSSSVTNSLSGLLVTEMVCYYQQSLKAVRDRNARLLQSLSRLSVTATVCCYQQSLKAVSDRLVVCYQQSLKAISDRNGLLLPSLSGLSRFLKLTRRSQQTSQVWAWSVMVSHICSMSRTSEQLSKAGSLEKQQLQ